jgi:universal stress protein A
MEYDSGPIMRAVAICRLTVLLDREHSLFDAFLAARADFRYGGSVRCDGERQAGKMTDFRRILCPVDFDSISLLAVKVAHDMTIKYGGKLYLLHVVRIPIHDMDVPVEIPAHPYWEQSAYDQIKEVVRQTLADDAPHEIMVKSGIPESAILETAVELGIDLIVMGSHARTGLAHLVLGSVAEEVVRRAPCPVMVIRPNK